MVDIAKCGNDECPKRNQCLRYTAPCGERQAWSTFEHDDNGCEFFISNEGWDEARSRQTLQDSRRRDR